MMETVEIDLGGYGPSVGGPSSGSTSTDFSIGSTVGGIIGGAIGGPVGAAIGGAIGNQDFSSWGGGDWSLDGSGREPGSGQHDGEGASWFNYSEGNLREMLSNVASMIAGGSSGTGNTNTIGGSGNCSAVSSGLNAITSWLGLPSADPDCEGSDSVTGETTGASIPVVPFVKRFGVFIVAVVFIAAALYMLAD